MNNATIIEPEIGVPLTSNVPYTDLRVRAMAACETAKQLAGEEGFDRAALKASPEDIETAKKLAAAYAENATEASRQTPDHAQARITPPALLLTGRILEEFGHAVVQDAVQIRHMVTNKLIEETEHPEARIRLKALELLGKVSDVGLFAEKSEITVTHRSTAELRASLKEKLGRIIEGDAVEDAQYTDIEDIKAVNRASEDVLKELGPPE